MKILITAGPTREYLDDVRFISNSSSGKAGYALAEAFASSGDEVVLISGPVEAKAPGGCEVVKVESALEMRGEVFSRFDGCDILVMTSAVCDWRPAKRIKGKAKKEKAAKTLELAANPDILEEAGRRKGKQILVGFALESENIVANAAEKMKKKNCDFIVANNPDTLGRDRVTCTVLAKRGQKTDFENITKKDLGRRLVEIIRREKQKGSDSVESPE